tara:strand:+ start:996 stop:1697 length:702 start_codon:yes stop_codon:yes gene_type:complete
MSLITVNLSFYNQNDVLVKHVLGWKSWSKELKEKFSFCIIDDCSKTKAIDVLSEIDLSDLNLSIYRVQEDLVCNIAGVRNLSAQECKTEWMVILDMDTLISEELASSMTQLCKAPKGSCFKFNRRVPSNPYHPKNNQPHPAVCLLQLEDYWDVGGCEEDLVGHYGQTDPIFWYRASNVLTVHFRSDMYLDYIPEGEAVINRDTSHNQKLFEEKRRTHNWSTDFVRFKWEKVHG